MNKLRSAVHVWIKYILNYPKLMIVVLAIATLGFGSGLPKLQFDSSIEFLMPAGEPIYQLGERVKRAFLNNKTLLITSIEPGKGKELFSAQLFEELNLLVEEVEEYKAFDLELENSRLETIIRLGNAQIREDLQKTKESSSNTESPGSGESSQEANEDELDALFLEGDAEETSAPAENAPENASEEDLDTLFLEENNTGQSLDEKIEELTRTTGDEDIWDLNKEPPGEPYVKPLREKQQYDISEYNPLTLSQIKEELDPLAWRQLQTILLTKKIDGSDANRPLSAKEYGAILEGWETLYLYKSMQIIQGFMNPISGEDISGENNELKPVDFIKTNETGERILPKSKADFKEYERKIKLNPLNNTGLYAQNEKEEIIALGSSIILRNIQHYNVFGQYLWNMFDKYNSDTLVLHPYGSLIIENFMTGFMQRDLSKLIPLVFFIVILTFYLNFRSLRGVILPTLTVALGAIWTMGLMGHLGFKMSLLVSILPSLLIAIGSSYSIHMFNQYMLDLDLINEQDKKGNKNEALLHTMVHISVTIFLAALTTFISFMTLSISQVTSLRDFGIFAATGSLLAMSIAFILLPAVLSILKPLPHTKKVQEEKSNRVLDKLLDILSHLTTEKPRHTLAVFTVILAVSIAGLFQIKTETTPSSNFKDDSYVIKAENKIGELFAGTFSINLVIDSGKENGVFDPRFLNYIDEIQTWAESDEMGKNKNILRTSTFGDLIKRMHMAMNGDNPEFYKIPDDELTIKDYMEILSGDDVNSDGRVDSMEQFVDAPYRRVNLVIRTGSYNGVAGSTETSKVIVKLANEHLNAKENPGNYTWHLTGNGINFALLGDYIVEGQLTSILLSLVIIAILIFILFRSFLAALTSIIPITVGISAVYGAMGFLGLPLDIPKAILSSIAIGIGIDDTIHFMKTLAHYLNLGHDLKASLRKTYRESGVAIIYTSVALVLGFSILIISNFKPIFYLGLLVSSVMFATTVGALIVLPSLIMTLKLKIKNIDLDSGYTDEERKQSAKGFGPKN